MNTEAEYNFIRAADFYLTDVLDYYLGGTTNVEWTYENYNDYIPNDSGLSTLSHKKSEEACILILNLF